jgi:replicative DNA helicase
LKLPCEANIVSCFYKSPELLYEFERLKFDDFTWNHWKVFFVIAYEIVIKEKKPHLDELTIGFYNEKHSKIKSKYDEYGGWKTISTAKEYITINNLDGWVLELYKWNCLLKLHRKGFSIEKDFDTLKDMTIDEIYHFYEVHLNDIFINVEKKITSHNLCDGLNELIDECHLGLEIGLPIKSPMLNETINGCMLGNISLLGACSGAGKTTLTLELLLPTILEKNEKCVMVINEQDEKKLRKEMLAWTINNVLDIRFNKTRLRQGKFTEDEMNQLRIAAAWLLDKKENKNITIIPLQSYNVKLMKKIINKYSALGVNYFILDTFKVGDDSEVQFMWQNLMQDMRKLYDTIKPSNKNVHLWCTLQLRKDKYASRYLTMEHIGQSKSVIDVASTVLLLRQVRDDEKHEGKNELRVWKPEGVNMKTKIPVVLHKNKSYCIIFTEKNREGQSGQFQIVAEFNMSQNLYKEVGLTIVPEDY